MAAPTIPPRPSRQSNLPAAATSIDVPLVPARPRRNVERSVSPNRDTFARSPLNSGFHKVPSLDKPSSGLARELPIRPPSVTLPSVGQEGSEYEHATPVPEQHLSDPLDEAKTTSAVSDLPLHAPKASLPIASAKQRIAAVTRTDSSQAAALGIGKAHSNASETDLGHTLTRSSSRQSQTRSRPASLYKTETNNAELEEVGIPNIGVQVPMYPNAGDVQAPTPSPGMVTPSQGVGFFNNVGGQVTPRHHSRTKSGREVFHGPPGSYGLHGHGVNKTDPFEKAWYDKHPEALARETKGEYGPAITEDRKEWALSSEELNKLVHTKSHPSIGASTHTVGTPAEDIGYLASEEYAQRIASRPGSTKPRRPSSQTFNESPLRKMSFPATELEDGVQQFNKGKADNALESEVEDDIIHVEVPRSPRRFAANKSTDDLGPSGGNTSEKGGYYLETGEGAPILASDESAFRPDAQYLQPAVEPEYERRNSSYLDLGESLSRPHSRSNSINKISENHLSQVISRGDHRPDSIGTPLEDVKEYEPLFDDEDEPRSSTAPAAIGSPEKKLKNRPDVARHHFPSRDVWEDAPDSLNYVTTVDSPQLPDESHPSAEHEPEGYFEPPEAEQARKSNITAKDQENFLPSGTTNLAKNRFKPEVLGDVATRPGIRHRFPSQDIWEDTPSSHMYTTTIDPDEEEDSPVEAKQPQIPTRPTKKSDDVSSVEAKQTPIIPGRPKPTVPARPSKLRSADGADDAPLSKTTSKESNEGAPPVKAKPAVPARPGGGKIAALQANFMSDLNKKLGLGPQAPKKEEAPEPEAVEEKAPLADARKGRARGPQRRKAGVSPSGAGEQSSAPPPSSTRPVFKFTISRPQTIWEVDEGVLSVPIAAPSEETAKAIAEAARNGTPASLELSSSAEEPEEKVDQVTAAEETPLEKVATEEAPIEKVATKESLKSVDTAVQTGETTLETTDAESGEVSKTTAFVDAKAPEEGTVVVDEEGKEKVAATS